MLSNHNFYVLSLMVKALVFETDYIGSIPIERFGEYNLMVKYPFVVQNFRVQFPIFTRS